MTETTRERLIEIAHGYQAATLLLTACRLGLFEEMGRDTRDARALARALELDARAVDALLHALAALDVLEKCEAGFRLRPEAADVLLPGGAESQYYIFRHNHAVMQRWAQLDECLRDGGPVARPDSQDPADMENFIRGMADISRQSSREAAQGLELERYGRMLDLGGGPGTAAIVFCGLAPRLRATVYDLEGPIGIARGEIEKAGLADRIETRVADYHQDDFGSGFDLVYISNIIHSLGTTDTRRMIARAHAALAPGGDLAIKEFFLEADRTRPAFGALFNINMLVSTAEGRSYTFEEVREMMAEAGFGDFRHRQIGKASGVLVGRKGGGDG